MERAIVPMNGPRPTRQASVIRPQVYDEVPLSTGNLCRDAQNSVIAPLLCNSALIRLP